jgi:hypothetical protein
MTSIEIQCSESRTGGMDDRGIMPGQAITERGYWVKTIPARQCKNIRWNLPLSAGNWSSGAAEAQCRVLPETDVSLSAHPGKSLIELAHSDVAPLPH